MKHRWLILLLVIISLLLVIQAQQPKRPADETLNDAPQKHYPIVSLEQQRAAMARLIEMRQKKRVKDLRQKTPPADWIQFAYHGLVLDANLDVIDMTPQTVAKIQESIFSTLQNAAPTVALKERGSDIRSKLFDESFKGQEKLFARELGTESLLTASAEQMQARYAWRSRILSRYTTVPTHQRTRVLSKTLSERVQQLGLTMDLDRPPQARSEYVETCRAQGVPIPPDWPDPRWISQGELELVFISPERKAEVFAFQDPKVPGVCYALPRRENGSIKLLGIICQSATTGNACFWDNVDADGKKITGPNIRLDIDNIANGFTLGENCTDCHRGENVFTIHPGTALDLSRDKAPGGPYLTDATDPNGKIIRYTPIGQSHWVNPPALFLPRASGNQQSCTACHTLPQTSRSYCESVLSLAALLTMPPNPPRALWPPETVNPRYSDHITFLATCP